jgi:hypothetical protein
VKVVNHLPGCDYELVGQSEKRLRVETCLVFPLTLLAANHEPHLKVP